MEHFLFFNWSFPPSVATYAFIVNPFPFPDDGPHTYSTKPKS